MRTNLLALFLVLTAGLLLGGCGGGSGTPAGGPLPDLAPAFPPGGGGGLYYEFGPGGITVYVENLGLGSAADSYVQISFNTGTGPIVVEAATTTGVLAPGARSGPIVVPLPVGTTSFGFTMTVDSRGTVPETDETNNEVDQTLLV
jgi:subtilase family serine protease